MEWVTTPVVRHPQDLLKLMYVKKTLQKEYANLANDKLMYINRANVEANAYNSIIITSKYQHRFPANNRMSDARFYWTFDISWQDALSIYGKSAIYCV